MGPPADKVEMIKLIRTAYDRGVTLFDTADPMVRSRMRHWWAKRSSQSATR